MWYGLIEKTTKYSEQKPWHNIHRMMAIENWLKGNTESDLFEEIVKRDWCNF